MTKIILAGTGHRPDKLGGYGKDVYDRLVLMCCYIIRKIKPDEVISGMALGFDQALAEASNISSVPFTAAMPFEGQEGRWPQKSKNYYLKLIGLASKVVVVSDKTNIGKAMQDRNKWMVDHCNKLIALWDGSAGGTANCVRYAESTGVSYRNYWGVWKHYDEI